MVTTKKNPSTLKQFETAIKQHMADPATVSKGSYGFKKGSKVYYNKVTNNAVVVDKSGNFVTVFKLEPNSLQYQNFMKNGVLR